MAKPHKKDLSRIAENAPQTENKRFLYKFWQLLLYRTFYKPVVRFCPKALFISPIVNMEKLITDMMMWSNVTEDELESKKEIPTEFGETLSWEYLCYVRKHPIKWNIPTCILYGGKDHLTSRETISEFAEKQGADLTVMEDGEHWFHTNAQMQFLDDWLRRSIP